MANLAAADVTVIDSWTTGSPNGKRNHVRRVKWTNTTAGGASNLLLASAFGFTKVLNCSAILLDATTKQVFRAAPSADGTAIYVSADGSDDVADLATSTDYAYATLEGV